MIVKFLKFSPFFMSKSGSFRWVGGTTRLSRHLSGLGSCRWPVTGFANWRCPLQPCNYRSWTLLFGLMDSGLHRSLKGFKGCLKPKTLPKLKPRDPQCVKETNAKAAKNSGAPVLQTTSCKNPKNSAIYINLPCFGTIACKKQECQSVCIQKHAKHYNFRALFSHCFLQTLQLQCFKNKMQPTNPNAHTYVNATDAETHGYAVTQKTFLQ